LPVLASAAGGLDGTFGAGGRVVTDFGQSDTAQGVAVQRDGKIVAVGTTGDPTTLTTQFALARYLSNGSLDASFGAGGKVTTTFGGRESRGTAVALQSDGKIVAAGFALIGNGLDIALARYNPNGSLDSSFGVGGKVLTDFGARHDVASGLVIQPDGKLVVVGTTRLFGLVSINPPDFALARYNPNGSLDPSFDNDGKVSTPFLAGWEDVASGIALARDGKIVAAGYGINRGPGSFRDLIEVARYNPNGSLDASFEGDGKALSGSSAPEPSHAYGVVVQPDRKVVVAGHVGRFLSLVRYTVRGRPDSSFGAGGVATANFGTKAASARALARQPDGKFVAVGVVGPTPSAKEKNDYAFAVARFDSAGKPDKSFSGGAIATNFGAAMWDEAWGLALQPNGRVVVAGFSAKVQDDSLVGGEFALARYLAPPCRVPNVRGNALPAAKARIAAANCSVGRVRRVGSKTKKNRVISQKPRPGATLAASGRVNLVVSRGKL
jgi:uncharacterized delta-60 repeat protein